MAKTTRRAINKIDMVQSAKLINLIEQEFAIKKIADKEFAEYASSVLGFPVAASNVENRRSALGIPSTQSIRMRHNMDSLLDLIRDLEVRIAALEKGVVVTATKP